LFKNLKINVAYGNPYLLTKRGKPVGRALHPLSKDQPVDRIKQVWFCGVHTDVGGRYKEEELSTITLEWMITTSLITRPSYQ
jgi:hypothetical protein